MSGKHLVIHGQKTDQYIGVPVGGCTHYTWSNVYSITLILKTALTVVNVLYLTNTVLLWSRFQWQSCHSNPMHCRPAGHVVIFQKN